MTSRTAGAASWQYAVLGVGLAATVMLTVSGCGSGGRSTSVGAGGAPTTVGPTTSAPPASTTTTTSTLTPTVPDCGAGAFEPKTLLVVCGTDTTTVTGVTWGSWGQSVATGQGTVNLQVAGRSTSDLAKLSLSTVVDGSGGPQYSLLTVTWTGVSPDGRSQDTYHLQIGG